MIVFRSIGIIILLTITGMCYAQPCNTGSHVYNSNLDKFVGTWKWTSGTKEVIIQLKKVHYKSPDNCYEDVLMGAHCYSFNGNIVENYLPNFSSIGQNVKGTIFLWSKYDGSNPDFVKGSLKDQLKNKYNYLGLLYINNSTPELQWDLNYFEGPTIQKPGDPPYEYGFTLPENITLVKQ